MRQGLVTTVVLSLVLAFVGGLLARKARLPPLLGYMLAGVALGPFTPGFVGNAEIIGELAEVGVILLMFGVGLHFSLKDLLAVARIAFPTALIQLIVATCAGAAMAHILRWELSGALVFGLGLSVASTVVALRALEERNTLDSINGNIAVGTLIVQDLCMVLALVLLPALASSARLHIESIAIHLTITLIKVAVFLALVLVVGKRAVPWILEHVARSGSRELFTLSILATALGIAFGSAILFGVSFALGAFFAGVVLSESDFSYQAAANSLPFQDAFAVLFFVSIGMLFDPSIIVREPLALLATLGVITVFKSLAAFVALLALRHSVRTALIVTASLAQIGEFSFILAGLAVEDGMLPRMGRDLILAGALLSITLNPLLFGVLTRLSTWLEERRSITDRLERMPLQPLATLMQVDEEARSHAIVVGYGRVGAIVGKGLKAQGIPITVVEQDRRRAEALRQRNVACIYGDASTLGVLKVARADRARLIVIATPEGFQTRRIIEIARQLNPDIEIGVRTHSETEVGLLEKSGVGIAIMGERELAFGLLDYALGCFEVSDDNARKIIQRLRVGGEGGAFERRAAEPPRRAPELRHRQTRNSTDLL
jgi:CPA2 family monovalent cation:H+ antiporter-2